MEVRVRKKIEKICGEIKIEKEWKSERILEGNREKEGECDIEGKKEY